MQVPKIVKVTLNVGYGKHAKENNFQKMLKELICHFWTKPVHNKTTKSISNF